MNCPTTFTECFATSTQHDRIMVLNIFVDSDNELIRNKYVSAAQEHNQKLLEDPYYYDSGFDLYLPVMQTFSSENVNKVDFLIRCSAKMLYVYNHKSYDTGYYIYPRSSISKTSLRLANNTGIIDAGYRGHIIGMFDCIQDVKYDMFSRFVQICAPNLAPIYVNIVSTIEQLGPETRRGDGGFGSTGL